MADSGADTSTHGRLDQRYFPQVQVLGDPPAAPAAYLRHSPINLLLHLLAVPLFLLSAVLLPIGLWRPGFVPLALGAIGLLAALALQRHGHRFEEQAPEPFAGKRDAFKRLLMEHFPRFLLSGAWWRAWRRRR